MERKCQVCDFTGPDVEFVLKPVKTHMGHKNFPHCPQCNSAMTKKIKANKEGQGKWQSVYVLSAENLALGSTSKISGLKVKSTTENMLIAQSLAGKSKGSSKGGENGDHEL